MSQVVDTQSAKEFMTEALDKISSEDLNQICSELEIKSKYFQQWLAPESIGRLSRDETFKIFRNMFSTRRKTQKLMKDVPADHFRDCAAELLYGKDSLDQRFQAFSDRFDVLHPGFAFDMASELLHFTFPDRYWLWTRWMWNSRTRTGALPLVLTEDYELDAPTVGGTYLNVGKAVAFVHQVGEAAGYQKISSTLFGTDVFLSCVYVVYVYTVLRMRMTQEFNKVMPGMPEFSRRLLGVFKMED